MTAELTRRDFISAGAGMIVLRDEPSRRLVDSHVHVWTRDPGFPFAAGATVPTIDASAEALLEKMQANGISRTVLIQVVHYKYDNRYLVDTLKRFPGRFAGVCRVDPTDPAAPEHLSRWTELGCHGVRLSPAADASGDWIKGPLMKPLWKRCSQLRIPMTHLLPVSRLKDVMPLVEAHPDLTVVIDHMADCPVDDPIQLSQLNAMARYPKVFVKISHMWSLSRQKYPYADAGTMVARVRDAFSAERLMWGTDWPIKPELASYEQRVALYTQERNTPFFSDREREAILWRTADRVWPASAD